MSERGQEGLVQQFVAQAVVETFDESVLPWLSRRDVTPIDLALLAPSQDYHLVSSMPFWTGLPHFCLEQEKIY